MAFVDMDLEELADYVPARTEPEDFAAFWADTLASARSHPFVDGSRVVVHGGSQGGGLSIAVAGLVGDLAGVLADVPFLQQFRRATQITDGYPYKEIANFCKVHRDKVERVFRTLSYFDG